MVCESKDDAVAVELCADPYGIGCQEVADGGQLGHRVEFGWDGSVVIKNVWISLCRNCSWWEADWDYENDPEGPMLPRYVVRVREIL